MFLFECKHTVHRRNSYCILRNMLSLDCKRNNFIKYAVGFVILIIIYITYAMKNWQTFTEGIFSNSTDMKSPWYDEKPCKMTMKPCCRLGNNMFQHMVLIKLSVINGCQPLMQADMVQRLDKCFVGHRTLKVINESDAKWYDYFIPGSFEPQYKNISAKHKFVKFNGYPYRWQYLQDLEEETRKQFKFHPEIVETSDKFLTFVKNKHEVDSNDNLVGIHIRRTDYVEYLRKGSCNSASLSYLSKAIQWMIQKHPGSVFVVASDNVTEARAMIETVAMKITHLKFEMVPLDPCETMAVISSCHHVILTQGTFGFWSAYLSGGDVVYITNYCYNNTSINSRFKDEHMLHWHGIES